MYGFIFLFNNSLQNLKVRSSRGPDQLFTVSNLILVLDFKKKFIEKLDDKNLKIENVRMFCLGKELRDDLFLYSYDIIDDMAIQAMFKK